VRRRWLTGGGHDAGADEVQRWPAQGSNTGLCKEGEREVMARRQSGRARANNSDVVVAAALRGGDAEGICPDAIGSGELARGGAGQGYAQASVHQHTVPTPCEAR
jgi:hypothetical protein